jgi:hypothetical protein
VTRQTCRNGGSDPELPPVARVNIAVIGTATIRTIDLQNVGIPNLTPVHYEPAFQQQARNNSSALVADL